MDSPEQTGNKGLMSALQQDKVTLGKSHRLRNSHSAIALAFLVGITAGIAFLVRSNNVQLGSAAASSNIPQVLADAVSTKPGEVLVKFKSGVRQNAIDHVMNANGLSKIAEIPKIHVLQLSFNSKRSLDTILDALKHNPNVEFAEPNWVAKMAVVPNDLLYSQQWHLPKISAPTAWDTTTGDTTNRIAICDTGVNPTHADLAAKLVDGWNFYDNNSDYSDVYGHGTAVAGTAAAISNNVTGVAGVTWGSPIIPVRVSSLGGDGFGSTIASCIIYAADHGARAANVSYRMDFSSTVTSAAQYMQSKGGVVAMSSGNNGTVYTSPDNTAILVVSATDSNDAITSWSNTGSNIDLSAPGVSIRTTDMNGSYSFWSGTSFSAPIVAGTASLVISANPTLTADQIQTILKQSADDLGTPGWDSQYGWGRVNASKAVALACTYPGSICGSTFTPTPTPTPATTPTPTPVPHIVLTPNILSFSATSGGSAPSPQSVNLANSGGATLNWTSLTSQGWCHISPTAGTLTAGANTSLSISVDAPTSAGTLNCFISIIDPNADNSPQTITVTYDITSAPTPTPPPADTTAPSVSITSPLTGATVAIRSTINIDATASDNLAVSRVEFYVGTTLTCTDTAAPYSCTWKVPGSKNRTYQLQAKAYDAAGNVGSSSIINVTAK